MQSVQLVGLGIFEVVDVDEPLPSDGEVVVRMLSASVCGSDLRTVFGGHLGCWC